LYGTRGKNARARDWHCDWRVLWVIEHHTVISQAPGSDYRDHEGHKFCNLEACNYYCKDDVILHAVEKQN
jgi:hypothetical protein